MWIRSTTMKELLEYRNGNYLHHDQYTNELTEPELVYCYANTIVLDTKSSHYSQNGKKYRQFILLEDFYTIAKDKDIEFDEAVKYALLYGDVHIRCTCPAWVYWSYAYQGTQLKYLYGLPKENRVPERNNVNLNGTICKHLDKAMNYVLSHVDEITAMFKTYYDSLKDDSKLVATDNDGKEITIGVKNGEGDVFYEDTPDSPDVETSDDEDDSSNEDEKTDEKDSEDDTGEVE